MDKKDRTNHKKAQIGKNVVLHGDVYILGESKIEDNVEIFGPSYVVNSTICEGSRVIESVIEDSIVGESNNVGPFAHLRVNSKTLENVRIGNFVEIKNSIIGAKTKVAHLAYVGDAEIGDNVNVGCGAIFVNFNGKIKQKTVVGDGSFIGSNCNIIAPVAIGKKCYICAGTTITKNIEDGDFVIGRTEAVVKKGKAAKYLD